MKRRLEWVTILGGLVLVAGCSSTTSETQTAEEKFRESLAATSVSVSDVSQEGGRRMLNPLSILTGALKNDWTYHLSFDFNLKTGDKGTLALDLQFTDNGRAIPVPTALNDNPVLNIGAVFTGSFKGAPLSLNATGQLRNPTYKVVTLSGSGTANFADLVAEFTTASLSMDFNTSPLPFGTIDLNLSQPDFGNWTGSATFQGTPVVHVVATNGTRTFDLHINLLTGDIS
jgi:hypothetical protein